MPPKTKTYELRIALEGARPPIWRRFLVSSSISLPMLHHVLQIVMGWQDCHLHRFVKGDRQFYMPSPWSDPWAPDLLDERKYRLDQLLTKPKDWMRYVYDFGDNWRHKITLQKVLPADPKQRLPICLSGERRCPPEDSGGLWGYYHMLEVVADPTHEEHELYSEWLDDDFDPADFDVSDVNFALGIR